MAQDGHLAVHRSYRYLAICLAASHSIAHNADKVGAESYICPNQRQKETHGDLDEKTNHYSSIHNCCFAMYLLQ